MNDEIPLKKKIDTIFESLEQDDGNVGKVSKNKTLKFPRKAKVRRGRIKKGWVGVIKIDENGNVSGEKQRIVGSVFSLKEGTYHATDGREIRYWNGKFPVLFQPTWRINPINFNRDIGNKNETYGQPYVMARMLKDTIKTKGKGMGNIIIWLIVGIGAFFLIKYIFKF